VHFGGQAPLNPIEVQQKLETEYKAPVGFAAYPSAGHIPEVFRNGAKEINKTHTVKIVLWEETKVDGKLVIDVILDNINRADFFMADLTGTNPNVLFELGYAIAKNKHVWILIDTSITRAREDFQELGLLSTIGYTDYSNSSQIVSKFFKSKPYEELATTIFDRHIKSSLFTDVASNGVLYMKSLYDTEPSIKISKRMLDSPVRITIDDPNESLKSLLWYAQNIFRAQGVICHFTSTSRDGHKIHNARAALASGLAAGFDKSILLLADSDYLAPLDYRLILQNYKSAAQAESCVSSWLAPFEEIERKQQVARKQYAEAVKSATELRGFQLQLGDYQAENEEDQLGSYFVETAAYREALAGHQTIFVGRKGTGKTANLFRLTSALKRQPSTLVCSIKPAEYEIEAVIKLFQAFEEIDTKGHVIESLWKFLLYTEIANATARYIEEQVMFAPQTDVEKDFLTFISRQREALDGDFSVRLERAVKRLLKTGKQEGIEKTRIAVSEALHTGIFNQLRILLGKVLAGKTRVAVLIDNLDKPWKKTADIVFLSDLLLGLLATGLHIPAEFARSDSRRQAVDVSVAIFIRSDIFAKIVERATEPDKLAFVRLKWEDPELLLRIIEARYEAAHAPGNDPAEMWNSYFCSMVNGMPIKKYLAETILPRPRDIVYLVKEAVSTAVNRNHKRVEETDFLDAEKQYSHYAFESILVENGVTIPQLEALLFEFAGKRVLIFEDELEKCIKDAGLPIEMKDDLLNHLIRLTFLGMEVNSNTFEFVEDPKELKKAQILSAKIARQLKSRRRFKIHPAFHSFLNIQS
jgi:hypothetical protein